MREGPLTLGIDQGGHSSRAVVLDETGQAVASGQVSVGERRLGAGRVEQDPEEIVGSVQRAVAMALADVGSGDDRTARPPAEARLAAAGLATQRSSIVCWDRRTGAALSPVLSWQDRRAAGWLERHRDAEAEIAARTGLRLSPHYGASKLRWCLDHVDAVKVASRQGRLACGPLASFLLFRLLEERPLKVDPANAGRTLLLGLETLDWDAALLERFGIDRRFLPACVPTLHEYGHLTPVGLRRAPGEPLPGERRQHPPPDPEDRTPVLQDVSPGSGVPLRAVNGDQSAALFAWGDPDPTTLYVNIGTGAFLQRLGDGPPRPHPRLLASVVLSSGVAARWVLEGTVNGAASALDWLAARLGIEDIEARLPAWLEQAGAEAGETPLFLNGISGLGSPFWVPDFPSRFVPEQRSGPGEAPPWRPFELAAAVVDSIVFLIQANLEEMRDAGPRLERIVATGGLSRLDALCQRLADLSGLAVERPPDVEATARGIAWLAAGEPREWESPGGARRFDPAPHPRLEGRYRHWLDAMPERG